MRWLAVLAYSVVAAVILFLVFLFRDVGWVKNVLSWLKNEGLAVGLAYAFSIWISLVMWAIRISDPPKAKVILELAQQEGDKRLGGTVVNKSSHSTSVGVYIEIHYLRSREFYWASWSNEEGRWAILPGKGKIKQEFRIVRPTGETAGEDTPLAEVTLYRDRGNMTSGIPYGTVLSITATVVAKEGLAVKGRIMMKAEAKVGKERFEYIRIKP